MDHDVAKVRTLFDEVIQAPAADRAALLASRCAGDTVLQRRVEALIATAESDDTFLSSPTRRRHDSTPGTTLPLPRVEEGPGTRIGPYKLLQMIGEGGFGVVFMAEQERPVVRRVALKIIKLGMDTRQVIARFEAERQALAMMDHPNIAKVLDAGATDTGRPYFVMELVKGVPITEYCDSANLSTAERLALFIPVCHAVQHAHHKGIIHRDIKPSNVLITLHDGVPVPKVIDFGIAKATQGRLTEKTIFTEFRQMIGTPEYMSPEQAEMSGLDIDTRADVYSLGVLLYELLTGVTPFDAQKLRSAAYCEIQRILREVDPPKPSTRISTLGQTLATTAAHRRIEPKRLGTLVKGDLDWIVMKAIEKDRTRRYDTANGLAADVQRHLAGEPVVAAPPSTMYRMRKFIAKHRAPFAAAGLVGVALLAGFLATGFMLFRAVKAEDQLRGQNAVVIEERNRAQQAEKNASSERTKAEAEARRAQLLYAEGLISNGDALVSASEFRGAYAIFADARAELSRLGESLERLDLSLVRLFRLSPPPLWSVELGSGASNRWTMITSRDELVSSRADGVLAVTDLLTGETLRTMGNTGGVRALLSTDGPGGPLVIASTLGWTRVLDPLSGAQLREAKDDRAVHGGIASVDGRRIASLDQRQHLLFWDVDTMEIYARAGELVVTRFIAASPDGALVAGEAPNYQVIVWDFKTGARRSTFTLPDYARGYYTSLSSGVSSLAFSADSSTILIGETDGKIVGLTLDGTATVLARPTQLSIVSLVMTPDGHRIIAASDAGEIHTLERDIAGVWRTRMTLAAATAGSLQVRVMPSTGAKACDATPPANPEEQGVVIGLTAPGALSAWPLATPSVRRGDLSSALSTSSDGLLVAGVYNDPQRSTLIQVRDAMTGRAVRSFAPPDRGVAATAFGSSDETFYFSANGGLWRTDLITNRSPWAIRAHEPGNLWAIAPSGGSSLVATGCDTESVARVWDAQTGQLKRTLTGHGRSVWALAFVPEAGASALVGPTDAAPISGQRLVVGPGEAPFVSRWDLRGESTPRRAEADSFIRSLALSPDHRTLAVTGGGTAINLVDVDSFNSVGTMGPLPAINYTLAFVAPDAQTGRWAVSNGRADLRAWDVLKRKEAIVLFRNLASQGTNTLVASPDGSAIYAAGLIRLDFTLPRLRRELEAKPSVVQRAELYARWGLWSWVRTLVGRELSAGRAVPALLQARAAWMCGDYSTAKAAFAEAAQHGEVPEVYAQLCASVEDAPLPVELAKPSDRPPDPTPESSKPRTLEAGVLDAADVSKLRPLIGTEVVVEGIVATSAWSRSGKAMNVNFTGLTKDSDGMLAVLFSANREAFDKAFGGDVASAISGQRVRVRGTLIKYGGYIAKFADFPQIVISDPTQVTIVK